MLLMKTGRKIMRSGISSAVSPTGLAAYFLSYSDASVEMAVCESDYGPQLPFAPEVLASLGTMIERGVLCRISAAV